MLEHVYKSEIGELVNKPVWERDFGDRVSVSVEAKGINKSFLKVNILSNGLVVGSADLHISPMRNEATIIDLKVSVENRRQGLGTKLIQSINTFLDEVKLNGTLVDGTTDKNLSGFYLKNGWMYEEEGGLRMYRLCKFRKYS
jgi:ribosomal protein S18 acetylase RimI-like enzyme